MTNETSGISRRTLAKGAAWAVPAVAVAAATPAMASSGPAPTLNVTAACKNPGKSCKVRPKGYTVTAEICNTSNLPIYIYNVTFVAVGTSLNLTYAPPPELPFMVPAATSSGPTCETYYLNASSTNSANQVFTLNTTLYWSHTSDPANDPQQSDHDPVTDSYDIPGTPPDCICPEGQSTSTRQASPAETEDSSPEMTTAAEASAPEASAPEVSTPESAPAPDATVTEAAAETTS